MQLTFQLTNQMQLIYLIHQSDAVDLFITLGQLILSLGQLFLSLGQLILSLGQLILCLAVFN
jgi:hypothetical protein